MSDTPFSPLVYIVQGLWAILFRHARSHDANSISPFVWVTNKHSLPKHINTKRAYSIKSVCHAREKTIESLNTHVVRQMSADPSH